MVDWIFWKRGNGRDTGDAVIPCIDCGASVSAKVAARQNGLCLDCLMRPARAAVEARRAEFEADLESGALFQPLASELAGATDPSRLVDTSLLWAVYQDDIASAPVQTVDAALAALAVPQEGQIYLGRLDTHHLTLEVKRDLAVCTLMSGSASKEAHYFYALGSANRASQVAGSEHVVAGCPCCGVGMIWHPSRAHMDRSEAVEIFKAVARHDYSAARWLAYEPGDFCNPGRG